MVSTRKVAKQGGAKKNLKGQGWTQRYTSRIKKGGGKREKPFLYISGEKEKYIAGKM